MGESDHRRPNYDDGATIAGNVSAVRSPSSGSGSGFGFASAPTFPPGTVLADRYEILSLLGEGGMGAVYKAQDRELDRLVALKTIRSEMAGSTAMLARFKQEVLLASQITHRNVIRLYDLGEGNGVKFLTMEFVEGRDLHGLLQESGKFTPEEAVEIIRQVCLALEAAHAQGVIHRDLKPQNILREQRTRNPENSTTGRNGPDGRIVVMDFGLARTLESGGMTQTGALVGTMEYMSPEQALGEEIDARSDLFAVGLIFYELLTGEVPYKAETAVASLLKRAQERAKPPSEVDASCPPVLSKIVSKCLERERDLRYQSAQELLKDLDIWRAPDAVRTVATKPIRLPGLDRRQYYLAAGAVALLVILTIGGVLGYRSFSGSSKQTVQTPAEPAVSLAIIPFRNASGDPQLNWIGSSVAEMLSTDIGQSSQLRTIPPDRAHQVLSDLQISPDAVIDQATLNRIADFTKADTLVWGQYAKFGDQIRIDATLQNLKTNRSVPFKITVPSEKNIPEAVDQLAASVRQNLSVSPDIVKELQASSFRPSSESIDALKEYNSAVRLLREGRNLEAVQKFQAAVSSDSQFALAYSGLAQGLSALGRDDEAQQDSRKAVTLSQKLPTPEKYRISAVDAKINKDYPKAIEAYKELASALPDDTDVLFTLGNLYEQTSAYDNARSYYEKVLKRDPNYIPALLAAGRVELMRDNPQGSLDYLNRALSLSIQFNNDEQRALILQSLGVAYRSMNKPVDALRYYNESLDIKRRLGDQHGIADSLHAIAQADNDLGKPDLALKNFKEALKIRRDIGDTDGTGDTLIDLGVFYANRGDFTNALDSFKQALEIERSAGNRNYEALALNNIGASYFSMGHYQDARTYYEQALQLREELKVPGDVADTFQNLAETSAAMGDYSKSIDYYLRALDLRRNSGDKHGAATDSFSMGRVFEEQGRYNAAVSSIGDALKTLRELNEKGYWLAQVLSGYGSALNHEGRIDEARKNLDEAMGIAKDLKNDALVAEILNNQGDSYFFSGDYGSAKKLYAQALPLATRVKDRTLVLGTKFNLAKTAVAEGQSRNAISDLKEVSEQADATGLKYMAADASCYLGEAYFAAKDYARARQSIGLAISKSEKFGLKASEVRAHYAMARLLKATGDNNGSRENLQQARDVLQTIRSGSGDSILKRSDFAPVAQSGQ